MTTPRKNVPKTRGKPFEAGNPGRPKGARHKATLAAEAMLDGEGDKLTRKAIDMALEGDGLALRLCMERLVPPRRDRPLLFDLPPVMGAQDHPAALSAVITAVAAGELTPVEAQAFAGVLEQHRRAIETGDLERRLAALEEKS